MEAVQGFQDPSGKYVLKNPGAFPIIQVLVWKEEGPTSFKSNKGCMLSMSGSVDFRTQREGTLGAGIMRAALTGASRSFMHFFLKEQYPSGTLGDVYLAPTAPGDIVLLEAQNAGPEGWMLAKDVFVACDAGVAITMATQKSLAQGLFSGAGLFLLKAQGFGRVIVSSYGSIIKYTLQPGETRKVDNGYLVAWTAGMQYTVGKSSGSLKSAVTSGEGFATSFTGPGIVYVQTRGIDDLRAACPPPAKSGGDGGDAVGNIIGALLQ